MSDLNVSFSLITQILDNVHKDNSLEAMRSELAQRPRLMGMLAKLLEMEAPPLPVSTLEPFRVENNQILKDGRLWKGLGMNFRELPFFGLGLAGAEWTTINHLFAQLDGAVEKKAKIIRAYCAHKDVPLQQAIPLVRRVLDEAQKRGLYVILVLTDNAGSDFFVPETPDLRDGRYTWKFINNYKTSNYWRYVDGMTKALADHPAIFSWEPMNEITAYTYPLTVDMANSMFTFWRDIAALIRNNSPKKMISNGFVSAWEAFVNHAYGEGQYALKLARETDIDILCFHSYSHPNDPLGAAGQHIRNEVNLIKSQNVRRVAFILEETAGRWENDFIETDSTSLKVLADGVFSLGFSSVMLWAVSFPYAQNIGIGGAGYFNGNAPPHSTRWHNAVVGWFPAVATELERAFS